MSRAERVAGRIAGLAAAIEAGAAEVVAEAAASAALDARARAPVDSGELRAGISAAGAGRLEARVISAAPHAAMVEFGTSRMAPQPYLLPAAEAARAAFFERARAEAARALREG